MEIANICAAFTCTPDKAAELRGRVWRRTTIATMDAMVAHRLKREFNMPKGTQHWSAADHEFWKMLVKAGGFTQPPIDGSGDGDGD